jgi:hypothetical protein
MAAVVGPLAIVGGSQAGQPGLAQGGGVNSDGWTLGFTGNDRTDKGQVQAISPSGTQLHGAANCVVIAGTQAVLTGTLSDGQFFRLRVKDRGEGTNAAFPDEARFEETNNPFACTVNSPDRTLVGNVQVR